MRPIACGYLTYVGTACVAAAVTVACSGSSQTGVTSGLDAAADTFPPDAAVEASDTADAWAEDGIGTQGPPVDASDTGASSATDASPCSYPPDAPYFPRNGNLDAASVNSCGDVPTRLSCDVACTPQNAGSVCLMPHGCNVGGREDLMCVCDEGQWQCPSCSFGTYATWCACQEPASGSACTPEAPSPNTTVCDYPSDGGQVSRCNCNQYAYDLDGGPYVPPGEGGVPPVDGSVVTRWQWSCSTQARSDCPPSPYDLTDTCTYDGNVCDYQVGPTTALGGTAGISCSCSVGGKWSCFYLPAYNEFPTPGASCLGRPRGYPMQPGNPSIPHGYTTCTCQGGCMPNWHCTP